jgi:hypothetical protein
VVWTGKGRTAWPRRDESFLVERYGSEEAADLLPVLQILEEEFYSAKPDWTTVALPRATEIACDKFRAAHPEIAEEAVQAFAWCYSWDWK